MSTSKSQAEIDFENASDEDIINPKGATRPRAGQEELPIGTLVEAVLRGEQELGARPTMNRQDKQVGQTVASPIRKRSVKVAGHKTSISLEEPFWQALREIAREREMTTGALLNSIASKRVEANLSSAVRVFVLEHFRAACQKETKS
jgi:predicted DNA-binding ribbon-helix-helix protein